MSNRIRIQLHLSIFLFLLHHGHFIYSQQFPGKKDSLYNALKNCKTDTAKIKTYFYIAQLYTYNSNDSCVFYGNKILELSQKIQYPYGEGLGYITLGDSYFSQNNLAQTIYYYLKAKEKLEQISPNSPNLPRLYGQLVTAYAELMDYQTAEEYGKKTLELAEQLHDSATVVVAYNNIGDLLDKQGKYLESLSYYEKSLKLAKSRKIPFSIGIASYNIGHVYNVLGNYPLAIPYLREAMQISVKIKDTEGVIYNYIDLGQVALKQHKLHLALTYADSALYFNKSYGNQKLQKDTYLLLADIYHEKGDNSLAYVSLNKAMSIKDSIYNEVSRKLVHNLTTNQKIQSLTNKSHETEKALNKQQIKAQILIVVGSVLFVILLLLLVIMYQRNKHTTLLKTKNAQIEAQSASLQELNGVKDRLISIISHDLRGPLNQIKAILEMFHNHILTEEDFTKLSQKLKKQVDMVSENLENVLHWANAQLKGKEQQKEQIKLDTYISQILELYESSLTEKHLSVKKEVSTELNVFAQKEYLRVALRNLMSNAIKFSHKNSEIILRAEETEKAVFISVMDKGIGMSPEQIQNIMANNTSISTLGTLKEEGTGIGLRLSKEFIEKSGGKMEIQSELGRGTTFIISIPKTKNT